LSDLIHILTVAWYIVEICLGVGFIIFVHELGHFAVAKLCGVKCEKFYLGFDIGGWKFCKFRWGETEYGIGILPLGGYVKMLGQEDNPAKLKEEIERAKLSNSAANEAGKDASTGKVPDDQLRTENPSAATDFDLAQAEKALYDPRSYLAKSVPKRMAIISAGVVMNVIFALLMASLAYSRGVDHIVSKVGHTLSGGAAWQADLRPRDVILEIDGKKITRYEDVKKGISFSNAGQSVTLVIQRPGEAKPLTKVVRPRRDGDLAMIGVQPMDQPILAKQDDGEMFLEPGSSALKIADQLGGGDRIAAVDGNKIEDFPQFESFLVNHPEKPVQLTLDCTVAGQDGEPATNKLVDVTLPPQPVRTLGLVMEMGEIAAVQDDSPAKEAGILPGDMITEIDGKPIGDYDPMQLPDLMRRRVGETVPLTLRREGSPAPIHADVKLRQVDWNTPLSEKSPVAIPQLGVAYRVLNRVARVVADGPAAKAGIAAGATIESATIVPPEKKSPNSKVLDQGKITREFEKKASWPRFFADLQIIDPNDTIELKLAGREEAVKLHSADAVDWFNPDRGLRFQYETFFQKADGIGDAFRLGASETWDSLTYVLQVLRGMGTRQISPTNLGGPGTIIWFAYLSAKHGFPTLLLFLTMLSANLAVINVLPIPMLDGGHLVFLAYEGVRGKPANERVQIVLSVIGLVLLLTLMIFVIGLDITRFTGWLFGK
jgi:regulator of sigma E protease